jgi:hypothetical protein
MLQLGSGIDSRMPDERLPSVMKSLQRLGLPAGLVQGKHQPCPAPLAERVLVHDLAKVADEAVLLTELDLGFNMLLDDGESPLLQPAAFHIHWLAQRQSRKGLAVPQSQGALKTLHRPIASSGPQRPLTLIR